MYVVFHIELFIGIIFINIVIIYGYVSSREKASASDQRGLRSIGDVSISLSKIKHCAHFRGFFYIRSGFIPIRNT